MTDRKSNGGAYCPQCNVAMLCPCPACAEENEGKPGVFWKYANDGNGPMICGNCLYNPEKEYDGGDAIEWAMGGWDGIASRQMRADKQWPEILEIYDRT